MSPLAPTHLHSRRCRQEVGCRRIVPVTPSSPSAPCRTAERQDPQSARPPSIAHRTASLLIAPASPLPDDRLQPCRLTGLGIDAQHVLDQERPGKQFQCLRTVHECQLLDTRSAKICP